MYLHILGYSDYNAMKMEGNNYLIDFASTAG